MVNGVSTQGSLPEEVTGKLISKGHSSFMKPVGEKTGLEVGTARTKGLGHGRESKVSMAQPSEWRKTTEEEADQTGTGTVGRARTSPLEDDLDLTVYEIRLHRDQSAGAQGGGAPKISWELKKSEGGFQRGVRGRAYVQRKQALEVLLSAPGGRGPEKEDHRVSSGFYLKCS